MTRTERTVMLEEFHTDAIDDATKREYVEADREEERSRSDVINAAVALVFGGRLVDEQLEFLRQYGDGEEVVIERIGRHVTCADCNHTWRLKKPIEEYDDGPRCSECGSFEIREAGKLTAPEP